MAITQTNTNLSYKINEGEVYKVKNSNGLEFLETTFAPTTKLFTFDNDYTDYTLNAYVKKVNYPNAVSVIAGTADGDEADTDIDFEIDMSTVLTTYGTGKYIFELWAEPDEGSSILLYPENTQRILYLEVVNRISDETA